MSEFLLLQNRVDENGRRVVYAWDLSRPEAVCEATLLIIPVGADHCARHVGTEAPCVPAWRTPGECRHERVAFPADPKTPMCTFCGATGTDRSEEYLRRTDAARMGFDAYEEEVETDA